MLSSPVEWNDEEPDFSRAAEELKNHRLFPRPHLRAVEPDRDADDDPIDWDFDQPTRA